MTDTTMLAECGPGSELETNTTQDRDAKTNVYKV